MTQTPEKTSDRFVTTRELTQGRSTKAPTTIRPRVLEMPMTEMAKLAFDASIPFGDKLSNSQSISSTDSLFIYQDENQRFFFVLVCSETNL